MIRERVRAGIEQAKADGVTLGRPSIEEQQRRQERSHQGGARGEERHSGIARELQTGVGTVLRIKAELAA
jgi:DNA invertase Pin-like site-specific DNA recombinase